MIFVIMNNNFHAIVNFNNLNGFAIIKGTHI